MKSYASVRRNLPLASLAARFLLIGFLVFATYNPSGYAISIWIVSGSAPLSARVFVAFGLMLTWLILVRIVVGGLQQLGVVYVCLAFIVVMLLTAQYGVPRGFSMRLLILIAELGLTVVLTFGLVFSFWVR